MRFRVKTRQTTPQHGRTQPSKHQRVTNILMKDSVIAGEESRNSNLSQCGDNSNDSTPQHTQRAYFLTQQQLPEGSP